MILVRHAWLETRGKGGWEKEVARVVCGRRLIIVDSAVHDHPGCQNVD